ncbi:MAG: YcjF family protein [Terriglobia bacterium]
MTEKEVHTAKTVNSTPELPPSGPPPIATEPLGHTREARPLTEREVNAFKTVKKYMWISGGAGLIPVPFVDWAAVSGVQLKMIAELSKIYEVPFKASRGKAIIGSLAGFVLPYTLACGFVGSMLKAIPVVGALAGAPAMVVFCGAYAWALGNVFIQHFESGGTFLNFDPEAMKEYFRAQFEEGRKQVTTAGMGPKPETVG